MTTTIQWQHPAGHRYLHAVLVLTRVVMRPESGVFEVDYGVWENGTAYRMHAAALHEDSTTFVIHNFGTLRVALHQVARFIQDNLPNIVIPEEENQ